MIVFYYGGLSEFGLCNQRERTETGFTYKKKEKGTQEEREGRRREGEREEIRRERER